MNDREITALLAYAVKLDPRSAPADPAGAAETLEQWLDLLADVPLTAPHPNGRGWHAGAVVRHHIANSPYPIKPSDVSRPWGDFRRDVLSRHTDPVPAVDPDNPSAYRAELLGARHAVATGAATATTYRELTGGDTRTERDQFAGARLAALGEYVPRTVAEQLAAYRPRRAERERRALAGLPDPLDVVCTWCGAVEGEACRSRRVSPRGGEIRNRQRTTSHPCRTEAAAASHTARQEQSA